MERTMRKNANAFKIICYFLFCGTVGSLTTACSMPLKKLGNGTSTSDPATQLVFYTSLPSTANSGALFSTQPYVLIEDASGKISTTANNTVTLVAYTNSTCTATASGTFTEDSLQASSGVAIFTTVTYNGPAGTIYVGATASGLTTACSGAITIGTGSAYQTAFSTQPSTTETSGSVLSTQPVVEVEDSGGNLISSASNSITLKVFSNSSCTTAATGTLSATANPVSASSGSATFAGVTYTGPVGTIYLGATSNGLVTGCSKAIAVSAGSAYQLAFSTEPSTTNVTGSVFSTQPVVEVEDSGGNLISSASNSITLGAFSNSNCTTSISGLTETTNPLSASSGKAAFTGVTYSGPTGTIYIGATASGLVKACSSAITIDSGPAYQLVFSTAPSTAVNSGQTFGIQPIVAVEDSGGNLDSSATNSITLGAYTDSNCTTLASGNLSATTNPVSASSGHANFAGVTYIGKTGTIYIGATSTGLVTACSSAVTVYPGSPYQLGFSTEPSQSAISGTAFGTQPVVEVEDSAGNFINTATDSITLAAYADSSCSNSTNVNITATTNPVSASSGSANVAGVTYSGTAGIIYIGASTSGLVPACSKDVVISLSGNSGTVAGSCSVSSSGNVYCWGNNTYGNLGVGEDTGPSTCGSTPCSLTPVEVEGVGGTGYLSNITSVSQGSYSTCALSSAGNVYCWGDNEFGELGVNSYSGPSTCTSSATGCSMTPVEVEGVGGTGYLSNIVSIATNAATTCAVSSSGNVYCWGDNNYAELGQGGGSVNNHPSNCTFFFGNAPCGMVPYEVVAGAQGAGNLSNIISISEAGPDAFCAVASISSGGNVYCWGYDAGYLGNGGAGGPKSCNNNSAPCDTSPIMVKGVGGTGNLANIISASGGNNTDNFICAINSSNNVYCWGGNLSGDLGNNSTTAEKFPTEVLGVGATGYLSSIIALATGAYDTCGVSSSGYVYCWGDNSYGELGQNESNGPTSNCGGRGSGYGCAEVPYEVMGVGGSGNLSSIIGITAVSPLVTSSNTSFCALSAGGNDYCWGDNTYGELGNNATTQEDVPVEVVGVGNTGYLSGL